MYAIVLSMFPDSRKVDKASMNYTVVINVGVWLLALIYYFVWGYRFYSGPKSNLDKDDDVVLVLNQKLLQLAKKKVDASIYVKDMELVYDSFVCYSFCSFIYNVKRLKMNCLKFAVKCGISRHISVKPRN